jgi:HSP20 family protein
MIMKLARREQRQDRGALTPFSGGGWPTELSRIRNEINRLFEDPFAMPWPSTSFYEGWAPPVDIYEDKDKYIVKAELPGMKKEDLNVSLDGNTLSISGERKHEEEKREGESYRSERYFGRFQRSVTLPAAVLANKIDASYKDGVLSIQLPKSEEAKPKQIQVKTS